MGMVEPGVEQRGGGRMKITIPEIPPSWNEIMRMHYHQRNKEVQRWAGLVGMFNNSRKQHNYERAEVKLTYYFPDKRRRDPDNYSGKVIMDALVSNGVIKDDSFANVELVIVGGLDRENPRVEVEVTPL